MSQVPQPPTGAAPATENVQATIQADNTHSVSSQILGQVFNPLVRRFNRSLGTMSWECEHAMDKHASLLVHFDPLTNEFVQTWMRFVYHVELLDLAVELVPDAGARLCQVSGLYAWIPSIEAYPSTEETISQFPTAATFVSGPRYPGGLVEKTVLPVDFSYGLQRQVKPMPYVGGTPRLAILAQAHPCLTVTDGKTGLMKVSAGTPLYTVRMVATFQVIQ